METERRFVVMKRRYEKFFRRFDFVKGRSVATGAYRVRSEGFGGKI